MIVLGALVYICLSGKQASRVDTACTSASGTKLLGILINVGTRHCLVPTLICQLNLSRQSFLSFFKYFRGRYLCVGRTD